MVRSYHATVQDVVALDARGGIIEAVFNVLSRCLRASSDENCVTGHQVPNTGQRKAKVAGRVFD